MLHLRKTSFKPDHEKDFARFQVSSRIAHLLSQEYSSSEKALKELVDNAWDADAGSIHITLPRPMTDDKIEIVDDGTGMTEEELKRHFLDIAADRRAKRGERSANKNRRIKERKGIGKFAGLMAASEMRLETSARGVTSSFTLRLVDLASVEDIETLPIEIITQPCAPDHHDRNGVSNPAMVTCLLRVMTRPAHIPGTP